jgi:hypothetical protein
METNVHYSEIKILYMMCKQNLQILSLKQAVYTVTIALWKENQVVLQLFQVQN